MLPNTAPFDNTSHPAISVPAGTDDGLPVGTMFVSEAFDDDTVLGVADAFAEFVKSGRRGFQTGQRAICWVVESEYEHHGDESGTSRGT